MALSTDQLVQLETLCAASDGGPQVVAAFRSQFPGMSLTRCEVSDMGADEPYRQFAQVDMYLVNGSAHCWQITADPALATGIVLARHRRSA
ncbi:MAG: hypothetical protein AB7T07_02600 [Steroidobacteraceae bacterium]